jgi:flavin-dependent dehydrogenase
LVGAGGTKCPVYRAFFRQQNPQARTLQTVVLEQEFAYDWQDGCCHLWFFGNGLPGYSWYVPKADGYLNVGVGGMAKKLKSRNDDIKNHWQHLTHMLEKKNFVNDLSFKPSGYSYYLRSGVDIGRIENAFVIGDAAGLASRDMGEGIGPAVRSGILAANSIAKGTPYSLASVSPYSIDNILAKQLLTYMFE